MGHGSDVPSRREWEAALDDTAGMRATTALRRRATRAGCRRLANRFAIITAQLAAGRATCARRLRRVSAPRPTTVGPRPVGTAARRAALQAQLAGAVTTDSSRCLTAGAAASRGARVAF